MSPPTRLGLVVHMKKSLTIQSVTKNIQFQNQNSLKFFVFWKKMFLESEEENAT